MRTDGCGRVAVSVLFYGNVMWISEIKAYDKKRKQVILDDGAETFLLYGGELRRFSLKEGEELPEKLLARITEEILKPRAKKRALYYLKNGDKTKTQMMTKLRKELYPEAVIEETLQFLSLHHFVDDRRFAETYIEELRGKRSGREILQKLRERGISQEEAREALDLAELSEDEYEACERALRGKLGRRFHSVYRAEEEAQEALSEEEKRRAYMFLCRKGFSRDAIEHCFSHLA